MHVYHCLDIKQPDAVPSYGRSLAVGNPVEFIEDMCQVFFFYSDAVVGNADDEDVYKRQLEAWHDAQQIREEALDLFSHGIVDLKTRAQIERLYWSVTRDIRQIASGLKHAPDEFRKLDKLLADKYFCNFSLFQYLPDSWAIDQIFPIMPIPVSSTHLDVYKRQLQV